MRSFKVRMGTAEYADLVKMLVSEAKVGAAQGKWGIEGMVLSCLNRVSELDPKGEGGLGFPHLFPQAKRRITGVKNKKAKNSKCHTEAGRWA